VLDLANPHKFTQFARRAEPFAFIVAALLIVSGLYLALFAAPADYQQGEAARIMYVHVPAAWMALFVYAVMAALSALALIFRFPLADVAAKACAGIGLVFTAVCLATGSLWGRPMWGTWWEWDARLTSVLVLFFLYLGYIALWRAIEEPAKAARAAAILAIVGAINVPIIHFSVEWWSTLHQGASVFRLAGPAIDSAMLWPIFALALGFMALFFGLLSLRMRTELIERRLRHLRLQKARAKP